MAGPAESTHSGSALGPEGQIWYRRGVNVETLAAGLTLTWKSEQLHRLDPGGAIRAVTLPAEGTAKARQGGWFMFYNSADADGEDLTIQSDTPATIVTVKRGHWAMVALDGASTWRLIAQSGVGTTTYSATVTVTAAQLLALNATPIAMVAAPGAGLYIEFVSAHLLLDFNSKAHAAPAAGEDLIFSYTNGAGEEVSRVESTSFLDAAADAHRIALAQSPAQDAATTIIPVANAALVLSLLSGELGGAGDSPLIVQVDYKIRTLAIS